MAALSRALEARVYAQVPAAVRAPTLDLGCGDGLFASILQRLGALVHNSIEG